MPDEYYPIEIDSLTCVAIDADVTTVDNGALSTAWTSIINTSPEASEDQMWYLGDAITNLSSSTEKTNLLAIYADLIGAHPPRPPHK